MAEFQEYLAILHTDPSDSGALAQLEAVGQQVLASTEAAGALEATRNVLRERGQLEIVAKLFDVEIAAAQDSERRADLYLAKGHLYYQDFLDNAYAEQCFKSVLEIRPNDDDAQEQLAKVDQEREHWRRFVERYLQEAESSTDRQLTTGMFLAVAETYARYVEDEDERKRETETYLRKALEVDPRNRRAANHLERLLRDSERWQELVDFLSSRVDAAATKDERIQSLLGISELAVDQLERPELSIEAMTKVIALQPANARALKVLSDSYEQTEAWPDLITLYTNALKAFRRAGRPGGPEAEGGMLLQVAMIHWKRLDNSDAAEEYFRRLRKLSPAHPAALDFYRTYYEQRGEVAKLLQVLRQAQKALPSEQVDDKLAIAIEIAEVAEHKLAHPEKAIDAWKSIQRAYPDRPQVERARQSLRRLYRKSEKWNALLDLMKEDIEHLPAADVAAKVAGLLEVVEIYRDRLHLDVMVINTYDAIIKLDPHNVRALDDLIQKYRDLKRWNDLIKILGRKAELPTLSLDERVDLLRQIANLWSERFGNYAQAIQPLERLIELQPNDADAVSRLKDIYTRRRQWRALIRLLGIGASSREPVDRRPELVEMARLASDRLGDYPLAIQLWNQVLELPTATEPMAHASDLEALSALLALYEREKRYWSVVEILRRQRELVAGDHAALIRALEREGNVLADRLGAPALAANAFRAVLDVDPSNVRALRTLRELYAQAGDYAALEELYGALNQWDELVDALSAVADRTEDQAGKLALLERAAQLASEHFKNPDKVARAYERVLAVAPDHVAAARALVPVYERTHKWARLLNVYEILLAAAADAKAKLALHLQIRTLCEKHLGSKKLAFDWAARAYELDPESEELLADLERLGAEADAWEQVSEILAARAKSDSAADDSKLHILRKLGRIAMVRLHRPELAREYQNQVLALRPDDAEAISALEEIATQLSEWPDLVDVYRRRVDVETELQAKVELLFKMAFIEEERLADLDAAAATYDAILALEPSSRRALKALAKLQDARGDWEGLAGALTLQLEQTSEAETIVALYARRGALYENNLNRHADALDGYLTALETVGPRAVLHGALERFLAPDAEAAKQVPAERRVEVARILLPVYEQAANDDKLSVVLEVLRAGSQGEDQLDYDRRLVRLYGQKLGAPKRAYDAAIRVLEAAPDDGDNRTLLVGLARDLDRMADMAEYVELSLVAAEEAANEELMRDLALELAAIYDTELDDRAKAERSWTKVLELDDQNTRAYDALDAHYRAEGRWQQLLALLTQREQATDDPRVRSQSLLAICDLQEGVLDDRDGAIAAFQRVLTVDPASRRAYKALERLFADQDSYQELEALLEKELDYTDDAKEQIEIYYRRADLRARKLRDAPGAVALLQHLVDHAPGHTEARELLEELLPESGVRLTVARMLEPLYQDDGLWRDLCRVLRAQGEFAETSHEAADLLARVATIEEEELTHERGAFDTWVQMLQTEPTDERPRFAVRRLAAQLDRWDDAAQAYESAASKLDGNDTQLRGELLSELARIYDSEMHNPAQATSAYQRLLDVDPGNLDIARPAAIALDRLYSDAENWPQLIEILRKQADWADGGHERRELLARLAHCYEERVDDRDAAVNTWRDALAEEPDDLAALDALERLYAHANQHSELIEILRRRVEVAEEPEVKKHYLQRIARIQESELEDLHEAIVTDLEVLDYIPDDHDTLVELSRLYRLNERYSDLLDIIERRLAQCTDLDQRVALTYELGKLLQSQLSREAEALERFAEVLMMDPRHADAAAAVELMLDDGDLRMRAAEILEPLYDSEQEYAKLTELHLRVADRLEVPRDRLERLRRVATLRERQLGDKAGAMEIIVRATRESLAEPELPELLSELVRLVSDLGREEQLIDIYRELAPDILDGDLQRRLYLDVADLVRAIKNDAELAAEYYSRVLDSQPDDKRALFALESIYRDTNAHSQLHDILLRKADLSGDDTDSKVSALAEAAQLCGQQLDRSEDAVAAWEQVLELAPEHRDASAALETLYTKSERYHDLSDLIERRLGFAFTVDEAVELRFQLGKLHEHKLHDPEQAVENYSAVLGGDPNHEGATTALETFLDEPATRTAAAEVLEPVYVSYQDWPKLVRIYEIKLEASEDSAERLRLTRDIARLHEDQLEDLEGAFHWYGKVFRELPGDTSVRDQLTRLATVLEDWEGLANIYQEYLDDQTEGSHEVRDVAMAAADIYDRRTNEVERGLAAYRRVLEIDPTDARTFSLLEQMLVRAQRWFALVQVYEDAIQATMDEHLRRELYVRTARVQEEHIHDAARAIEAYRAALDIDADDRLSLTELDRLYQEQGQWFELAELLGVRIERSLSEAESNELRVRLAEVLESRLEDAQGAIDQYEVVLTSGVGWNAALQPLERLVLKHDYRERIADILEPVYRDKDWWQKLVIILDAKLEFVEDQVQRVSTLREIAQLHETRGGDQRLALGALSRAWREEPSNTEVYGELFELASKLAAWDPLIETLEAGIKDQYDYEMLATVLAHIADVHETKRDDRPKALEAWRRVIAIKEDNLPALAALDRLLAKEQLHAELVGIIERRADLAHTEFEDESVANRAQMTLLHRAAALKQNKLDQIAEAIATYKNILAIDDADHDALDALEHLYRGEEDYHELVAVLLRKIELASDAAAQRTVRFAAAEVYESQLNDSYEAIAQLIAVTDADAQDAEALCGLDRLYSKEQMWTELLDVLDRRAAITAQPAASAELAFRAAELVRTELLEAEAAVDRYAGVLALLSTHEGARAALDGMTTQEDTAEMAADVLESLYRSEEDFSQVAQLYERRLDMPSESPEARYRLYARLVEVHEHARGDLVAAFEVWSRALKETPDAEDIKRELERLAAARGSWQALADLYHGQLDSITDSDLEYAYAMRLAGLYEDSLGDLDRAAEVLTRALAAASDEREALACLDRIYTRAHRYSDLAQILIREADASFEEDQQAGFLFRLGDLREQHDNDIAGAVDAYRDVLERSPSHTAARSALERLQQTSDSERATIIGILEPLYESDGDFARLADVLSAKLSVTPDALDRAQIYARIAEIAENNLGDQVRALDAAGGWLVEDPNSEQALGELERLAEIAGRWTEVVSRMSAIVDATDDPEAKQRLLLKLGEVQLVHLRASADAEATFLSALENDPESEPALASLERIYRQDNNLSELARTLARRSEVSYDPGERRRCLVETGRLREGLGDTDGAIQAWTEVLAIDEGDSDAHVSLAKLYEHTENWTQLIDLLRLAARFATDSEHERVLRTRIAQVSGDVLGNLEDAVDAWQSVLDVAPEDQDALLALEAVHAQREDWLAVQEILQRRFDLATTPDRQILMLNQLALVARDKQESPEDAIVHLHRILDIDNTHFDTYAELERLLGKTERWHDLIELLERLADVYGTLGQSAQEIACLARAADVWETSLDNPDEAASILEKILNRDANCVPALTRLARIYESAEDWQRCGEILERALGLGPTGRDAADLYYRLGEVEYKQTGDVDQALRYWGQALHFDGTHESAIAAVLRLAQEREDWGVVADMVSRREAAATDPAEKLALTLRLADLYGNKLKQPDSVIPLLEKARQVAPEDPEVLAPLADLYYGAGRHAEAGPIYERLADEARKVRRMKDVAKYRQRLAGILEAQGDVDAALAAYEEAFRVNPTNVATMAGLGRIYVGREAWDKARRVYRSMVLQNLDADAGITKDEVYYHLGVIHLRLDEPAKAKGMFQRGLEIAPDNAELQQALASLQS